MKTAGQYKEEFLKRASIGFLLKHWRRRYTKYHDEHGDWLPNTGYESLEAEYGPPNVVIEDVIWSRESGIKQSHEWTEDEFRAILKSRGHWKRGYQGKEKRQILAKKYRRGRSQN